MKNDTLAVWADLLARIRSTAPSAILAGGALRDLDNDRPVKDLDVFLNEDVSLSEFAGSSHRYTACCPGSYVDAAGEVDISYTFKSLDSNQPDLNIIQLRPDFDTSRVIDRMDFGLCRIGFDGENVVTRDEYQVDKANRTFTLTRGESPEGVARSLTRYNRISQKYEGWKLVVPDEFVDLLPRVIPPASLLHRDVVPGE